MHLRAYTACLFLLFMRLCRHRPGCPRHVLTTVLRKDHCNHPVHVHVCSSQIAVRIARITIRQCVQRALFSSVDVLSGAQNTGVFFELYRPRMLFVFSQCELYSCSVGVTVCPPLCCLLLRLPFLAALRASVVVVVASIAVANQFRFMSSTRTSLYFFISPLKPFVLPKR